MFSLDNFYSILHTNLIKPLHTTGRSVYFYPFGTYDNKVILDGYSTYRNLISEKSGVHCYFVDQEPLYDYTLSTIKDSILFPPNFEPGFVRPRNLSIFANSEHSQMKDNFLKETNLKDWYYFYHGFAALDWYRDYRYIRNNNKRFNSVFSCYNHLISKYRSYRLHLVSNLINNNLLQYGSVSLPLTEGTTTWKDIIEDPSTPLDSQARKQIYTALRDVDCPFVADAEQVNGTFSAKLNLDHLTDSMFHIVTETIYFQPKLHLTEKIFKPIVAKRPFILAGAVGNLAYLKRYGFKTFDRWIDESYDLEPDNYLRMEMITAEIKKLCALSNEQQLAMFEDMQSTLDYNFEHFYSDFKSVLVNEMINNLDGVLSQFNNGKQPNNHSRFHWRVEFEPGYLDTVRARLLQ